MSTVAFDPWATALALTTQADAIPPDVHGVVGPAALDLRRRAHLALCATPEFRARRRALRRGNDEYTFRDEWVSPDGSLVQELAAKRKAATRVHRREVTA